MLLDPSQTNSEEASPLEILLSTSACVRGEVIFHMGMGGRL